MRLIAENGEENTSRLISETSYHFFLMQKNFVTRIKKNQL